MLAWIISVLASLAIGWFLGHRDRELRDSISMLVASLKDKADKKSDFVENKSSLLDPDTVSETIQREHAELMARINRDK